MTHRLYLTAFAYEKVNILQTDYAFTEDQAHALVDIIAFLQDNMEHEIIAHVETETEES